MYTNTKVYLTHLSEEEIVKKLQIYKFVGFQRLFIDFEYSDDIEFNIQLNKYQKLTDIKLFGKIIFHPESINLLKKKLIKIKKYRRFAIAVSSFNKKILTFVANDSRIDIISLTDINFIKSLTPGIISLLKQTNTFLEISLIDALSKKKYERSKAFREIYKMLHLARKNPNILLFGGAERENRYIRGPREIISVLNSIFEISLPISKRLVRENPEILVNRLKMREDPDYLNQGLKIIDRIKKD